MLAKRIIPCLDVKDGVVVKGIEFCHHKNVGKILDLTKLYVNSGADELVFYDIAASARNKLVKKKWIIKIAEITDIPFCVAGGISNLKEVEMILALGADKISINSPAIKDPYFISRIADRFGTQCVVVGIDSWYDKQENVYSVFQYSGDINKTIKTNIQTIDWVKRVQELGAGEIVLNVINQDGKKNGYDVCQLKKIRKICKIPLIASGGAGSKNDFFDLFKKVSVEGALAASVFHNKNINIFDLKKFLHKKGIPIRI
ncbi:imidazole glycerol phosphate synthase subunit HisF [Buchnera aphidicola (Kurisakia onigurumii)]|uniref:imidazole glycerol phosphate synthase subunit HisF n=1 Tax=Buchnera aphidicola TaxID=9 RepID=UPI0031B678D3